MAFLAKFVLAASVFSVCDFAYAGPANCWSCADIDPAGLAAATLQTNEGAITAKNLLPAVAASLKANVTNLHIFETSYGVPFLLQSLRVSFVVHHRDKSLRFTCIPHYSSRKEDSEALLLEACRSGGAGAGWNLRVDRKAIFGFSDEGRKFPVD